MQFYVYIGTKLVHVLKAFTDAGARRLAANELDVDEALLTVSHVVLPC
jgi:hypothetical protein